jgi:hypothetical protein
MAHIGFHLGGVVFADFATDPILQLNLLNQLNVIDILKLRAGDRVQAVKQICRPSHPVVIVDVGTQGWVELIALGQGFVGVRWDNGLLLCSMVEKLTVLERGLGGMPCKHTLTKSQMLAFESIFDLLIRLGFEEDTPGQRMVDRGVWLEIDGSDIGDDSIGFDQIAGRTVAEFVREGLQKRFLLDYLRAD